VGEGSIAVSFVHRVLGRGERRPGSARTTAELVGALQSIDVGETQRMGMFSDLMTKIFHHAAVAEHPADAVVPGRQATPAATATAVAAPVDVAAILTKLASEHKEKLEWRTSIVDLMKLVGMDSSIGARKTLATELHYTGDMNDSAAMNIWLHKEVMRKLADNGGKVPADLLSH
jgi:hypothetical protein